MKPKDFNLLLRSIGPRHLRDYTDRPLIEMWQARQRAWQKWDFRIALNILGSRYHDFQNGTSVQQMAEHLRCVDEFMADDNCRWYSIRIWRKTLPRKATREQRDDAQCLQLRAYMEFVAAVQQFKENPS